MKSRVKEWIKRYLPAEVISLAFTLVACLLSYQATTSRLAMALCGTWVGNIGYFGYLLVADIIYAKRYLHGKGKQYTSNTFAKNIKALVAEFGIAELADSLFIRPALMYYLPFLTGHFLLGVMLAKLIADITFYLPAIFSYELTKKRLRKFD